MNFFMYFMRTVVPNSTVAPRRRVPRKSRLASFRISSVFSTSENIVSQDLREDPPVFSQDMGFTAPGEELDAQSLLELPESVAHGRLGDEKLPGRLGEIQGPGEDEKDAKLGEIDAHSVSQFTPLPSRAQVYYEYFSSFL